MPISRVNFQNVAIPPATDSGGGGAGNAGAWTDLTVSDVSTDNGSYATFNVTQSSQSGFNINVEIAADTGTTNNTFPINTAAVIYIDTGISANSIADGDQRTACVQLMIEYYDISSTSSIITDTTYRASVCPFFIAATPPFTSGDKGVFGGSGWFGGAANPQYQFVRRLANTASTSNQGTFFVSANGPLVASFNEATLAQEYVSGSDPNLILYRYDSLGFWDNNGVEQPLLLFNNSQHYAGDLELGTNNIVIGAAFHVNGGTDAATTKSWDINIKWRKLLSEA
jgi:hypothetical protein